jgi:hypothetical protein
VPAIARAIGALLALSDGGTDNRTRPFEVAGPAETGGARLPGPGGFGFG